MTSSLGILQRPLPHGNQLHGLHYDPCLEAYIDDTCSSSCRHRRNRTPMLCKLVKGLDWSGVDFTPKSTPYVKKAVELQGSNAAPV